MKTVLSLTLGVIFILFVSASSLSAQDWKKLNPEMSNILVDTTLVRSIIVTMEPGQESDLHTHPAHFFYALTDWQIVVHYSDCKDEHFNLKEGDYGYSDPERPHVTENASDKPVKFLLVELKEHPYTNHD